MIDALGLNNVQLLLQKYFKGEDLYPTIVGIDPNAKQSTVDATKQMNLADWTSRLESNIFKPGYSPYETYSSKDSFCRAISNDFDVDNIGHRLYFNYVDDKVDFLTLYMNGCQLAGIPFCVKYDKMVARKDSVVVYVEQDKLDETARVLQTIAEKHPQFAEKKELPMSVVNGGWFGYSPDKPGDTSTSYNRKFTNCVNRAFFDVELFNKYRHFFSMKDSLTDFASVLFEEVKNSYIASGQPVELFERNEDALRTRFDDMKLQFALQFFSGEDRKGSGFVPASNEDGVVDTISPIMQVKSPASEFRVGITPETVLRTALQLIRRGGMSFYALGDDYGDFINSLSNNIRDELARENLSIALPVELQGLILPQRAKEEAVM